MFAYYCHRESKDFFFFPVSTEQKKNSSPISNFGEIEVNQISEYAKERKYIYM